MRLHSEPPPLETEGPPLTYRAWMNHMRAALHREIEAGQADRAADTATIIMRGVHSFAMLGQLTSAPKEPTP